MNTHTGGQYTYPTVGGVIPTNLNAYQRQQQPVQPQRTATQQQYAQQTQQQYAQHKALLNFLFSLSLGATVPQQELRTSEHQPHIYYTNPLPTDPFPSMSNCIS